MCLCLRPWSNTPSLTTTLTTGSKRRPKWRQTSSAPRWGNLVMLSHQKKMTVRAFWGCLRVMSMSLKHRSGRVVSLSADKHPTHWPSKRQRISVEQNGKTDDFPTEISSDSHLPVSFFFYRRLTVLTQQQTLWKFLTNTNRLITRVFVIRREPKEAKKVWCTCLLSFREKLLGQK